MEVHVWRKAQAHLNARSSPDCGELRSRGGRVENAPHESADFIGRGKLKGYSLGKAYWRQNCRYFREVHFEGQAQADPVALSAIFPSKNAVVRHFCLES